MATARKTASKVTAASFNPSDKAIAAVASGVPGKSARTVKTQAPKKLVVKKVPAGSKPLAEAMTAISKVPAPAKKGYAAVQEGRKVAADKKLNKVAAAAKVDKRRETPQIKIGKVIIERPARKKSDAFDTVPTIAVKNVADTIKVFSKLPNGCTWMADITASTKDTLDVYNKHGVHIAEVRIERKQ